MKISEFFAEIGFKFDTLKFKEIVKLVGDLNVSSLAGAASLAGLTDVVKDVIKSTDQFAVNLQTISKATGVSPDYIQFLENVSEQYGSTKQSADSLINSVSQLKLKIAQGQADATPFALMGISNFGDVKEIIQKTSEFMNDPSRIAGWAKMFAPSAQSADEMLAAFKTQILGQLGASPDMFTAMEKFSKVNPRDVSIVPAEVEERALAAHREWVKAAQSLNTQLAETVIHLTNIGTKILEFTNKFNLITEGFGFMTGGGVFGLSPVQKFHREMQDKVHDFFSLPAASLGGQSSNTVNKNTHFNMTVYAQDVSDFEKNFEKMFTRKLIDADAQVGQTTK